jgi:hypothetical protein
MVELAVPVDSAEVKRATLSPAMAGVAVANRESTPMLRSLGQQDLDRDWYHLGRG